MSKHSYAAGALALATLALPAHAAGEADLAEIRNQIRNLKDDYEARIRALEERLRQAESRPATPAPAAPAPRSGLSAFNPAISLVLQGTYAHLSQDPNGFEIHGFPAGGEIGPGRRGFSLGESELILSASIDDRFFGHATIALAPENEIAVEEAYAVYTAAPFGLAPKVGRFLSGIGYLNERHQHTWDFVDAPLAYQAFLGGRYANDGVQVKWVAPIDHFLELGGEVGSGDSFPGGPRNTNGVGSAAVYAHTGGDVGVSHSWRAGVSLLRTRNDEVAAKNNVAIADFVWKWAPGGNSRQVNFTLQGEYFRGREAGVVPVDSPIETPVEAYTARRSGWYAQGVYQFMPQWRIGARYDRLDPGAGEAFRPRRYSAMVDWSPSEFSRLRLQFARSQALPEVTDNQWFLQYIFSIGAHGAHKY